MSRIQAALAAAALCLAAAGCAAEHLEARDARRGPAGAGASSAPVVRPTALSATEKQLNPEEPKQAPSSESVYTCPMHPEIRSAQPGVCPKCGMTLQKLEAAP